VHAIAQTRGPGKSRGSPNHPTPILLSSPRTNGAPYQEAAFETDLPRIEASDYGGPCDRSTGAGCTNPPLTDDGVPANFYLVIDTYRRILPYAPC
jgi:hypothetical protein